MNDDQRAKKREQYHKKKSLGKQVRGKSKRSDWEFIAVDGEGSTDAEGTSIYQILSAYGRRGEQSIEALEGLSTIACLEFLLGLPYRKQKICVCGYGFTYDVCNIIKDVSWSKLQRLTKDETIGIYIDRNHRYKIRCIYKKSFEIWKMERIEKQWRIIKYVRVYDVIGFFQTSFLKAIEERKLGTPEENAIIEEFKARRGENLENDWQGWKRYNATECRLLVALMNDFNKVLNGVDIHLTNWWGAGAIAAYWFKHYKVKEHLVQSFNEEIDDDIKRAFFGGQIQRLRIGIFNTPVYHYDLCSAYPWGQEQLPSLVGEWRETDHFEPDEPWALYEIDWDFSSVWNDSSSYGALPYRTKHGSIVYPKKGAGIYWFPEVAAVIKHWPQCIKVVRGRVYKPESDAKPFEWIREKFLQRNALKKAKDPRNVPLKLGLNSLYGKTVQRQGMLDARGNRLIPPYQSYMWGGLITSLTRARMIDAVGTNPEAIIAVATDGLFSTQPLPLSLGTDLGDWMEEETLDEFELYANGVYRGSYQGGLLIKARGVEDREFNFEEFSRLFREQEPSKIGLVGYRYKIRRFFGYKLAVHRNKPEIFRKWAEEGRFFYIIGIDCFKAHITDTPLVYRIECTFGEGRKNPERKPRILSNHYDHRRQPEASRQDDLLDAEQPG